MGSLLIGIVVASGLTMIVSLAWPLIRKYQRLVRLGTRPRYRKTAAFLCDAERDMLAALQDMVGNALRVYPKVRLYDLLMLSSGHEERNPELVQRLQSQRVDFVVCDSRTSAPMLVVELCPTANHGEADAEQEQFLSFILESAGLPLLPISRDLSQSRIQLAEAMQQSVSAYITRHNTTQQAA